MTRSMIRTYDELIKRNSFIDRYNYLRLSGQVGDPTFGHDRYLNQILYRSREWQRIRNKVIVRDNGCDLGMIDYPIEDGIVVHHMNPITIEDIENREDKVFDTEFLICTRSRTHHAIHYGDESLLPQLPVVRFAGDTILWR